MEDDQSEEKDNFSQENPHMEAILVRDCAWNILSEITMWEQSKDKG